MRKKNAKAWQVKGKSSSPNCTLCRSILFKCIYIYSIIIIIYIYIYVYIHIYSILYYIIIYNIIYIYPTTSPFLHVSWPLKTGPPELRTAMHCHALPRTASVRTCFCLPKVSLCFSSATCRLLAELFQLKTEFQLFQLMFLEVQGVPQAKSILMNGVKVCDMLMFNSSSLKVGCSKFTRI